MSDNPHPAHKEILDVIPESLHEVVKPVLKKWDQGVNDRFAEIKEEYAGYEPFVKNNVDPKFVEQAVILAQQIQNEPEKVLQGINDTYELGYSNEVPKEPEPNEDDNMFDDDDIMKNPKVKAMAEALDKLQNKFEETQSEREEREQQEQFEAEIAALEQKAKEDNLPWNENFVIGCMASGMSGDESLKEYHKILGSSTQVETEENNEPPPNVMGGDGNSGSGSETPTFDVGGSKDSVNTFVEDLIKAQNESGQ